MSRVKCYLVKLAELRAISPKAYLAVCFDDREVVIPRSQVFGVDLSSTKSDAYWIAAWIVEKHGLQHSQKNFGWYDRSKPVRSVRCGTFKRIERIVPKRVEPVEVSADPELLR